MKIACIINQIKVSGGAERVMCELSNALASRGHEVHLITRARHSGESYHIDESIALLDTEVKCRIPVLRNLVRNQALHKILKKGSYDVAVSFMTAMNMQAILASVGTGVPIVVSERIDPRIFNGTVRGFARSLIYPLSEGFVFQTDDAKSCFSKKIQRRAAVIPNPVVTGIPQKTDYEKSGRIVAVGRLTEQKNYPLMLRAFAKLHAECPDYSLEIYGQGELLESLKALAQELSVSESVRFMGQRSDLHDCIKGADLYLMTSEYEGMSNALAEAMVMGLPCVTTNHRGGGAGFLVQDGVNGYLTPCGDEEALVERIKQLVCSREAREKIGSEAKKIVNKLSHDHVFGAWEDYLTKVSENNRR